MSLQKDLRKASRDNWRSCMRKRSSDIFSANPQDMMRLQRDPDTLTTRGGHESTSGDRSSRKGA